MKISKIGFYVYYRGFVYGNTPTNIISRIYNKAMIDKQLKEYGFVYTPYYYNESNIHNVNRPEYSEYNPDNYITI